MAIPRMLEGADLGASVSPSIRYDFAPNPGSGSNGIILVNRDKLIKAFVTQADGADALAEFLRYPLPSQWEGGWELRLNIYTYIDIRRHQQGEVRKRWIPLIANSIALNTFLKTLELEIIDIGGEAGSRAVARALEQNANLENFKLQCNTFGAAGGEALALALASNTTLKGLCLDRCALGVRGSRAVARALQFNSTLERLDILRDMIGNAGGEALGKALASCTALKRLNLKGCYLGPRGCKGIAMGLLGSKNLQQLIMSENDVAGPMLKSADGPRQPDPRLNGLVAMRLIGYALRHPSALSSSLKFLDLSYCNMGPTGLSILLRSLEGYSMMSGPEEYSTPNNTLEHLVLANNPLGNEGGELLASCGWLNPITSTTNKSLNALDICNCSISGESSSSLVATLLYFSSTLQVLDMGETAFGPTGGAALGRGLLTTFSLKKLDLSGCAMDDDGWCEFFSGLGLNATLEELCLNHNCIEGKAVEALCDALASHSSLRILEMHGCLIGESGTAAAYASLAKLAHFADNDNGASGIGILCPNAGKKLEVLHSGVGNFGAAQLGKALASNTSLQSLDLRYCGIGDLGIKAIVDGLTANTAPALNHLDLSMNDIRGLGVDALTRYLTCGRSSRHLKTLDITTDGNGEYPAPNYPRHLEHALARAWGSNWALKDLQIEFKPREELQREAYREWRRGKLLAFGMGMHARLGEGCCAIGRLDGDIFRLICESYPEDLSEAELFALKRQDNIDKEFRKEDWDVSYTESRHLSDDFILEFLS